MLRIIGFALAAAGLAAADDANAPPAGFKALFDGRTLAGWDGDAKIWRVENGLIVGSHEGWKQNEFLSTAKRYRNFVLTAEFRLVGGKGNSGIQFRSDRVPNSSEMKGYQADVGDPAWWGCLYDESRRNRVLARPKDQKALDAKLQRAGWNAYTIRALGDGIELTINGVTTVQYTEKEAVQPRDGMFGLQIHADGNPARAEFRKLLIQELPDPQPESPGAEGFVLRAHADRKYVAFYPKGYAPGAGKKWPAILFMHGSGERGADGVKQALVGLGPALQTRADFPMVAIFPQARETWKAGSVDSKAALAILDAMIAEGGIDPDQVHVTGLSMGGNGAWELATTEAKRWASATMVCGFGEPANAPALGKLPFRMFCGDRDMKFILDSSKQLEATLTAAGRDPHAQWYPGVGHNCWDLAYNTDELYAWMAKQRRGNAN